MNTPYGFFFLAPGEYGEKIANENDNTSDDELTNNTNANSGATMEQIKNSKKYTPINSYKPSGKLVYSEDLLNKIENKSTVKG
mgnify:CR=1 FL=1